MKQDTASPTNGHTAHTQEMPKKESTKATNEGKNNEAENEDTDAKKSSKSGKEKKETPPLEKFFFDALKDIYYAEQQLIKALPKMEKAATTEELKEAFDDHLHQTQKHVKRLEKIFTLLGKKAEGKKCEAIEGLVKEADTVINETEGGTMTRDVALIIAAQKVEHYEIAAYGGLVELAMTMQLDQVADILDTTLAEEEDTDRLLTDIAENKINMQAETEGAEYSWQSAETTT
jgi:ferritin-like metal-binding protein YciE